MKVKIFGKNMKTTDMCVYWREDVNMDDMMSDLDVIGERMNKPMYQKDCKIVTVRNWWINDTKYRTCEMVVNEKLEKEIRNIKFKAVAFMSTTMTKH